MKQLIILIVFTCCFEVNVSAQFKVGVFDLDIMVQVLPEYRHSVDSLLQVYTDDSLAQEFEFYQQEYKKIDSTFKIDSVLKKSKSILDFKNSQRQQIALTIINFEKIAEVKINRKRALLSKPLYEKVFAAYKKVQSESKFNLILKPNSYELLSNVENVFVFVAKELRIKLPQELIDLGKMH